MSADQALLRVRRLVTHAHLPAPRHPGDAGLDLSAIETATLQPGDRILLGTGLAVAVPPGWVGLIHPRSGLAIDWGVTVLNAPGTVDAGYRGELKVILVNHGSQPVTIESGHRIAQLILQRAEPIMVQEVAHLEATERGPQGFGSSGD